MKSKVFIVAAVLAVALMAVPAFAATVTLNTVVDTYVDKGNPTDSYGSSNNLYVAGDVVWMFDWVDNDKRTYLKFDLSSIPDCATITSATLGLYLNDKVDGQSESVYHVASDSWSGNITWNTRPDYDTYLDTSNPPNENHWETWDLLPNWNYIVDLTDDYLSLIILTNETCDSSDRYNAYDKGCNIPYLQICYTQCNPVPIPPSALLMGSGLLGLVGLGWRRKRS